MRRRPHAVPAAALAVLAGLLVTAPAGTGATAAAPPPGLAGLASVTSASAAEECSDALVVAVPGGGEGATDDPGATLSGVVGPLVSRAQSTGRTVATRVVQTTTSGPSALQGKGKRRTPAERAVTRAAWNEWRAPVPTLVSGIGAALSSTLPGCPDQLVYLVGYSQGAEAVHRYLTKQADADLRSRLVSVVLVGDPARVAGSAGPIDGDPAAPRSARGVSAALARKPLPALPGDLAAPVHTVCSRGDVVCDLGSTRFRVAQRLHRRYAQQPALLSDVGERYGQRLALWPRLVPGQAFDGTATLLFGEEKLAVDVAPGVKRKHLAFSATGLPPGLRLTARGVLTGTPTRAGTYEVGVTVRNRSSAAVSRPSDGTVTVTIDGAPRSEVSSGGRHTCEVRGDGTLWCWGANFYGQLGTGDTTGGPTPRQVTARTDWADVSAGGMHTCAVRDNGTLWCWGLNYRGQLGLDNRKDKSSPKRVGTDTDWESVASGWVHTCATKTDGSAWCWGDNDYGQLGDGTRTDRWTPVKVTRGLSWTEVQSGGWHTCGVARSGAAYCWGRNVKGQLGDGTTTVRINPAQVGQATDWLSVQPAWTHTCGLRQGGALSCWGGNEGGQLAGGGFGGTTSPQPVGTGRLWSAVQTGVNFSCALDTEQAMWCWGSGRFGQLDGTTRADNPTRMFEGTVWTQLDLGWLFGCGLTDSSSTATCWGNNETGELGGSGPTSRAPVARQAAGFDFNLVTFNVLGSNHTSPRTDAAEFSPARIRSEWAIDYLRSIDASVVGFQEIQRDQMTWFTTGAGSTYDVWPGTTENGNGLQTTIAWRKSDWRLLQTDLVEIPFIQQTRDMPLVQLEHKQTGTKIWVMNIHNAPQDYQGQRNIALQREIDRLKKVIGKGAPVFLIGDFNERQRAFCEVGKQLDFVAPRGGSVKDGKCDPPSGMVRIDWIFGSKDVGYSGYTEDRSPLVSLITDHAVLRTTVSVP